MFDDTLKRIWSGSDCITYLLLQFEFVDGMNEVRIVRYSRRQEVAAALRKLADEICPEGVTM